MRQRRWLKLVKDYDCEILYHPGKANKVADALSRKISTQLLAIQVLSIPLQRSIINEGIEIVTGQLGTLTLQPTLIDQIRDDQGIDPKLLKIRQELEEGNYPNFSISNSGLLTFKDRVCLPNNESIIRQVMTEAHNTPYTVHPGTTKMYRDLKEKFWWPGMKRSITEYVSKCLTCQKVKAEHQRPAGELQPLEIPEWKWEQIAMDFVVGLPKTTKGHDSIWVIIDRLTKSAHFIHVRTTNTMEQLAETYIREIVRLHGIPKSIVSDRDSKFTSTFWKSIHRSLGTQLNFSTAFHPQTGGQSERTIQTLEDMLRACVLEFQGSWSKYLPLVEFAYNNSYQETIGMAPYEALYGRKCQSPIHWDEAGERKIMLKRIKEGDLHTRPDLVAETSEAIKRIRQRMQAAQCRQKSYANT